ncbi:DMT family transporter [Rhodoferax ferrireducens]|uniref:DMT family transporter n=1 Tax=Rhodoferax ferrireducens TaxID=192843 RepID=UPI00298E22B4|nr:DMT family transporter [Rhodoferax ferrireducens]WPC66025.1 DMT family transporter [Rhodoferax ferrireducens]
MAFWRTQQGAGIALIVLATLAFAILDTVTKYAVTLVPVLMLLWFRYAFQALLTFALRFPVQKGRLFTTPNPRFQTLRGVLLLITSACSFFGLRYLPVGEFTAMVMLSPLVATAMAAWVLKDHVSHQRWLLMAAGLVGVLLVVRPGGQVFSWALLFPVLLVTTYGWFQVLTSRLSGEENPYTTHFYTGLVGAVVMSPIVIFNWSTTALLTYWPWFLLVGFLGTFGHLMLIRAYTRASAPVLTPYLYAQIAFATVAGWLAFKHVPDALAWLGIAVIAASGVGNALLSAHEVTKLRRAVAPAA